MKRLFTLTVLSSLMGIFTLTVLASFVVVICFNAEWASAKDLLQLLLPAETALLGSAIGFYFGSHKKD
jgi:O-antigen/teichoic acid export membrane protein